ncbi:DUF262 domain-containing protein [Helicobacter heilmannii]|uniref:DUF262 domain-containing protein n=1 Tax=Helicobacter heilmannii TaxID=35817 RepID=UPI0006A1FAD2|nr:DUF262 domain-containing protein [Helicobacter heilmannii]CRF46372.1 hypothetical protein HHE014_13780 [Helicobacter heilmannii]
MKAPITFLEFLDFKFLESEDLQKIKCIEVPMLQRDYAQGRKSQKDIATKFLNALFQVLEDKKQTLHLDLVYGYQDVEVFKLIDGQQRITTLWLLHFLLFKKAGRLEDIKEALSHFTYHTRESSKEFCEKLLAEEEEFSLEIKPSEMIEDKEGTFGDAKDRENDPTIKAIVHMLDLLYDALDQKSPQVLENYIEKLRGISFSVINMKKFGLGDDLYIKLNARGKLLSKFEQLKAFIEQAPIDQQWLNVLDNDWSDYFFDSKKPDRFDQRFFHFLHYANAFFALEKLEKEEGTIEQFLDTERTIDHTYRFLQNEENLKVLDCTIQELLPQCQELGFLSINGPSFFEVQRKDSKDRCAQETKLEHKKVAYFFALLALAQIDKQACLEANLQEYARVCKHFVENHLLDSNDDLHGFFDLFKAIAVGVSCKEGFYAFLSQTKPLDTFFHQKVFTLEQRKARLICADRAWEGILNKTSKHAYLVGYVGFLLDFSRVDGKDNLQKFTDYATLTMEIFNEFFTKKACPLSLLQRALLCFGDYSIGATNQFFGNRHRMGMFRHRQIVFRLFEKEPFEPQKYPKNALHKLLDNLLSVPKGDLAHKMQGIIKNYTSNREQQLVEISWTLTERAWWEQLLLQQKDLFDWINKEEGKECGRIYFLKDKDTQQVLQAHLLPTKKYSEKAFDLLGYALYCCCKQNMDMSLYQISEEYENGKQVRQFSINGFAIFADSQTATITLEHAENEQAPEKFPINLKHGTDVFKELQKAVTRIKKTIKG